MQFRFALIEWSWARTANLLLSPASSCRTRAISVKNLTMSSLSHHGGNGSSIGRGAFLHPFEWVQNMARYFDDYSSAQFVEFGKGNSPLGSIFRYECHLPEFAYLDANTVWPASPDHHSKSRSLRERGYHAEFYEWYAVSASSRQVPIRFPQFVIRLVSHTDGENNLMTCGELLCKENESETI